MQNKSLFAIDRYYFYQYLHMYLRSLHLFFILNKNNFKNTGPSSAYFISIVLVKFTE